MGEGKIESKWYVVDASGKVLGRLATRVASMLRGKHKPEYAPHMDVGDHIIVVNAAGIMLTGQKAEQKEMTRYSGYPGGLKRISYKRLLKEKPDMVVERAIKGMLPHTRLGRKMAKKLRVYPGPDHPHEAQKPEPLELG
jgi:large subunit ribosomal protein L13